MSEVTLRVKLVNGNRPVPDHSPAQWVCAQLGAREHYAIPRALHNQNKLAALCTDLWCAPGGATLENGLGALGAQAVKGRYHAGLADAAVRSFPAWSLMSRFRGSGTTPYDNFRAIGESFSKLVARELSNHQPQSHIFFSYDTTFLEAAQAAKERGCKTVVGQMDPGKVEFDIVAEEYRKSPEWVDGDFEVSEEYNERRLREWELADAVVVNSEWSRDALVKQGVPEKKIVVIPLCYELPASHSSDKSEQKADAPLKVLWLGQVNLRKGIRYLVEAAHKLSGKPVEFHVCGPLHIKESALRHAPGNMQFHGKVERTQVQRFYHEADVFVLPTLSDGFAITQLEAMAHGLPVIATDRCGSVVTDGEDGLLIPAGDSEALVEAIQRLLDEPETRHAMSNAARKTVTQFGMSMLQENLNALENRLLK